MEAGEVLDLFDSCWFERRIFASNHQHNSPAPKTKFVSDQELDGGQEHLKIYGAPNIRFSLSDRCIGYDLSKYFNDESPSKPKLEKILSGKEFLEISEEPKDQQDQKKRKKGSRDHQKKRGTMVRSLSALESEEVKGFMDLGFVFTDEDKSSSSLVSVIPGLQKWDNNKLSGNGKTIDARVEVSRPYNQLSEAWNYKRKVYDHNYNPLMNWKIPSPRNEINMKDHLKAWAQTVASTIR